MSINDFNEDTITKGIIMAIILICLMLAIIIYFGAWILTIIYLLFDGTFIGAFFGIIICALLLTFGITVITELQD